MSLEQLQAAVDRGCSSDGVWASRFAEGVRAALSFASRNPAAARALIDAGERGGDYRKVIDRFSEGLADAAPPDTLRNPATDEALARSIVGVVSGYLYRGSYDLLEEIAPHLVYMALLPYVGFDEARQWSSIDR